MKHLSKTGKNPTAESGAEIERRMRTEHRFNRRLGLEARVHPSAVSVPGVDA